MIIDVEIEYKKLEDHLFFEDYFDASEGYRTKVHFIDDQKFYLSIALHSYAFLVPRWEQEILHLNKKLQE